MDNFRECKKQKDLGEDLLLGKGTYKPKNTTKYIPGLHKWRFSEESEKTWSNISELNRIGKMYGYTYYGDIFEYKGMMPKDKVNISVTAKLIKNILYILIYLLPHDEPNKLNRTSAYCISFKTIKHDDVICYKFVKEIKKIYIPDPMIQKHYNLLTGIITYAPPKYDDIVGASAPPSYEEIFDNKI